MHTPNWKFLVTSSYGDYSVRVWEVATGLQVDTRTLGGRPTSLAITTDGQTLYTGGVDGDVLRWPIDDMGQLGEPTTLLEDAGRHASVSPDGAGLATT